MPRKSVSSQFLESTPSSTDKKSKKKGESPVIAGSEELVDKYVDAKLASDALANTAKGIQNEIIAKHLEDHQEAICDNGAKSVVLSGEQYAEGVTLVFQDRFSKIDLESKDAILGALIEALGDENEAKERFDELFEEERSISVRTPSNATINYLGYACQTAQKIATTKRPTRESCKNDEEYIERLEEYADAVSENRGRLRAAIKQGSSQEFSEIFSVDRWISTQKDMDLKQYDLPETVCAFLKQVAPSLKIKAKSLAATRFRNVMQELVKGLVPNQDDQKAMLERVESL